MVATALTCFLDNNVVIFFINEKGELLCADAGAMYLTNPELGRILLGVQYGLG